VLVTDAEEDWARVAAAFKARLKQVGLWTSSRKRTVVTGVAFETWAKMLGGQPVLRLDSQERMAVGVGWPGDAIERILAGEDPADWDPPPTPGPGINDGQMEMAALSGKIADLTPEDRRYIENLVERLLEKNS
jgi:hypothetical protein